MSQNNGADGERYVLVYYRVPKIAKHFYWPVLNSMKRAGGVSDDGSVWYLPERRLPMIPEDSIKEWVQAGVFIEVVRFDVHERAKVMEIAKRVLSEEIERIRDSFVSSVEVTKKKLEKLEKKESPNFDKARAYMKWAIMRAKRNLRFAEIAATQFDLLRDVQHLLKAELDHVSATSALEEFGCLSLLERKKRKDSRRQAEAMA